MLSATLAELAPLLQPWFTLWGSPVTAIEVLAFVLSLAMVVCNFRVNPWGWPLAAVSSVLYALLFASSKLYGEAGLQLLFIVLACWGWWQWLYGHGDDGVLVVHRMTRRQCLWAAAATAAAWPLLGWLLARLTDSDVPYLDALPTVGSITGQFLLGRKLVENWPTWIAVNLVSIGLFAVKGLWLTVVLYVLFAAMAVVGWRAWSGLVGRASAAG